MALKSKLIRHSFIGLSGMAAILFIPAGSMRFWQGWAYLAVMLILGLGSGIYLYKRDPQLLERRLLTREKVGAQKIIRMFMVLVLFSTLLLCGLDYRFGWSRRFLRPVPVWLTVVSLAVAFVAYLFSLWVINVNRFAASVIQVETGQPVISTGVYRMVRHPYYAGSMVMWLFIPLALGSYVALPVGALLIPVFIFRLLNEEKILRVELPGYSEYCRGTRYRLIPYVW